MNRLTHKIHPDDRLPWLGMIVVYALIIASFMALAGCTYTIKEGGPSKPTTPTQQKTD